MDESGYRRFCFRNAFRNNTPSDLIPRAGTGFVMRMRNNFTS